MPTTILHGETYQSALHRRMQEEAADIRWPCMNNKCEATVEADGDYCPACTADREYYAKDNAEDWERTK